VVIPSWYMGQWTFYYAHHSDMDTTQYVHTDVPSGSPVDW